MRSNYVSSICGWKLAVQNYFLQWEFLDIYAKHNLKNKYSLINILTYLESYQCRLGTVVIRDDCKFQSWNIYFYKPYRNFYVLQMSFGLKTVYQLSQTFLVICEVPPRQLKAAQKKETIFNNI